MAKVLNYVISIIGQAKEPFTIEEWKKRVFDPDFVASDRYAELLAAEVPPKKCSEALIAVYRNKASGDIDKLTYIFRALIGIAGDDRIDDFLAVVSEDLRTAQEDTEVIAVLRILPEHVWPRISEVARLRIENKLIWSIASGKYDWRAGRCSEGALATWAVRFLRYFTLKSELQKTLIQKLRADHEQQNYVACFFLDWLPSTMERPTGLWFGVFDMRGYIGPIVQAVANPRGPKTLRERLTSARSFWPDEWLRQTLYEFESVKQLDPEYFAKLLVAYNL